LLFKNFRLPFLDRCVFIWSSGQTVIIQPRFANGDYFGMLRKPSKLRREVGRRLFRITRMPAHRREDIGILLRQLDGALVRLGICTDGHDLRNARFGGAFQDGVHFVGEIFPAEMRVRVKKFHVRKISTGYFGAAMTEAAEVGARHIIKIQDIAFGGEGVGRLGEFVVFVPFVALGEEVEVEFTEVKKRFARAKLLRVITSSAERVQPLCQYFGDCGGCQYQHISYPAQLQIKQKQVADLFQRMAGLDPKLVRDVVPCPEPYGYRNRIMIRSQWDKTKQGLNIGFIRADNRLVVDIEECKISEPALNQQIQHVRKHPPHKGGIKVTLRIQPEDWVVPRDSFFQNNFFLLPKLVEGVRDLVRRSGSRFLVDVYCGVGFFAIETADLVENFVGVELDRLAIQAARKNMESRKITNGEFLDGRAEDLFPDLVQRYPPSATTLVIDPPRTGCPPESIALIREFRPKQIIYVSCHPATLARDLKMLTEGGLYNVLSVTPYDMFPQTQHVECVADIHLAN
jgi:23S rRNA (uracil1939-C5)-methyltransferase